MNTCLQFILSHILYDLIHMNKTSDIPLYLIESFLKVVESPSLLAAAEKLGLTQSALSRQMKAIEEHLPQKVFTFDGRKKVLTHYGQTVYNLLAPQCAPIQGLITQASLLLSNPENAHVRICGRGELLDSIASRLSFSGKVSFYSMESSQAYESVLSRKCDIGIIHSLRDTSELVVKKIFSNRLRIVVSKGLLKSKPETKRGLSNKLRNLSCVLYKSDDLAVERFLGDHDLYMKDLNILRIYPNYSALIKMMDAGIGWSVIPSNIKIDEKKYQIFEFSGLSKDQRDFYLCFRRELKEAIWYRALINEFNDFT